MPQVKNLRPWPLDLPNVGVVEPGDTVEVPADLAKNLTAQDETWAKVTPKKTEGDS